MSLGSSFTFSTLNDLLLSRSTNSKGFIGFLTAEEPVKTLSYEELYVQASYHATRLLSLGIDRSNVVLGIFDDQETHILLFWSCTLAGISYCPLAPLHPDPKRQFDLFVHLRDIFGVPVLLTTTSVANHVAGLFPALTCVTFEHLCNQAVGSPTDARVKPGDTVCFVLTSGSTGKPKAVALRHEQILASCVGKSQHHGTGPCSKFLNWIAFDHVASIIEIHIHALLLDALQYHVSPTAVLVQPSLLLRYSSDFQISYTFSPNFLLARLVKDSTVPGALDFSSPLDLSALATLISGGESVPLSTAVAVADILERYGAPRNALRAGFGMSETCAGSIYDTNPIPQDVYEDSATYLHVGKPVPGMRMRIVSNFGMPCLPGEPGHLQVSGAMVFRVYHNNQAATSSAFTTDGWFVTGDLGIMDTEGNLHLVGRDKDCLNINGAKISSTDVETYVEDAKIWAVSNVVACPARLEHAETETYFVFYQHDLVDADEIKPAHIPAVLKASRAIADSCAVLISKAAHVVLPLPASRFVRTALGKVSRTQLTASYLRGEFSQLELLLRSFSVHDDSRLDETDVIQRVVIKSVCEVLDLPSASIRRTTNIFDSGASSMHVVRIKNLIQERLKIPDIPTIKLLPGNVGEICDYLTSLSSSNVPQREPPYNPLVCLESAGNKPPVFLIHPGVGEILVFLNMAHQLADDRPIYAIRARGFNPVDEPFRSLEEAVNTYADAIATEYPNGPYYVAGYSYGGAIAFEVCKKLEAHGGRVDWLGILNLPAYIQFRMRELTWVEILFNVASFIGLIAETMTAVRTEFNCTFPELANLDEEPKDTDAPIGWIFAHADKARLLELDLKLVPFARWVRIAYEMTRAGRAFMPSGCVSRALTTIFCATPLPSMGTRQEYKAQRLARWREFSGAGFEMVDVAGTHHTMLSLEHSSQFAVHMRDAMRRAEGLAKAHKDDSALSTDLHGSTINFRSEINGISTKGQVIRKLEFQEVPVIDFSLSKSDPETYYKQLQFALETVGFLVFSNVPGFEDEFQTDLFSRAAELFGRPQEWKDSLGTSNSYALRGYFRADTLPGPHKAHAEAYRFGADMLSPGNDAPFWLRLHEGPNQWPSESDLPGFRDRINTLFERYHLLNVDLNRHICVLLNVPPSALDEFFPTKTIEFNSAIWHYFPVTPEIRSDAQDGFAQGMHEHRDPSTFVTCLIQNRQGLQVQNHAGQWLNVPMVPGGVVCNIGMQLMKLTGGKLVATTHRVNTLNIERDRFTIPYVLSTRLEKEIQPLPQFAGPQAAKAHITPNPKIAKLMAIADPLIRSGYARLSLFPAATARLYPKEFEEARQLGIV